ncbi:DUF4279 domain-containing protein [Holdemania massiliensis]|uniref:DUF4279 domain-containing protein n=1 Tax=Holdemania massiliensis TaxID=1468449 RepID=UPI003D2FA1C8
MNAGLAQDVWQFQIDKKECFSISEPLNKLQNIILPKIECLKACIEQYTLEVSVVITVEMKAGEGPELTLSKDNIIFLSKINAEFSLDLYVD